MEQKKLEELEQKANILCDAFPYIRDFAQKIIVIEYECGEWLSGIQERGLMQDIVLLKSVGMKPVLVHSTRLGMDKFRENKRLANLLEQCGAKAIGICGVDEQTLNLTITNEYIPVIVPNDIDNEMIMIDPKDTALQIAQILKADKLVYLSKYPGIFVDETRQEVYSHIKAGKVQEMMENRVFPESLEIIVKHCVEAVNGNVTRGHILDGRIEHVLPIELFSVVGAGTAIYAEDGELYPHEMGK